MIIALKMFEDMIAIYEIDRKPLYQYLAIQQNRSIYGEKDYNVDRYDEYELSSKTLLGFPLFNIKNKSRKYAQLNIPSLVIRDIKHIRTFDIES